MIFLHDKMDKGPNKILYFSNILTEFSISLLCNNADPRVHGYIILVHAMMDNHAFARCYSASRCRRCC